jgi:hypothetical protein
MPAPMMTTLRETEMGVMAATPADAGCAQCLLRLLVTWFVICLVSVYDVRTPALFEPRQEQHIDAAQREHEALRVRQVGMTGLDAFDRLAWMTS